MIHKDPVPFYAGKWLVQQQIKSKMVRMLMLAFTTTACTGAHDNYRCETIPGSALVAGFKIFSLYVHGWIF
jgi:hypothetical protein